MISSTARPVLLMTILLTMLPDARAAGRPRKPADLTDVTIMTATSMVSQAGLKPTPQNVANVAKGLLQNQQRALESSRASQQIPAQNYQRQSQQVQTALANVEARATELTRQKRPTVFRRLGLIAEFPFKAAGEVTRLLVKPFPDKVEPIARFFLGQYVGRRFDALVGHMVQKHGSGSDIAKFVSTWNKIALYKDNPSLTGTQLKERLKELSRGEIGKVFDRLVQDGLKKIGGNATAREVFVAQMEMARKSVERNAGKRIDELLEKHKKDLENLTKDLTGPMPSKEFRRRLAQVPKNLRRWMVETIAQPPKLEEMTTQEAVSLKAILVANPDEGSSPLEVMFYGGSSLGGIAEYSWTFGDGGTAGGDSTSHVYEKEGEFNVVLIVRGTDGKTDSTARIIKVKKAPAPKILVRSVTAKPAKVQPGGSVALTAEVGISDCEGEGQVTYAFSTEGLARVQGSKKADLQYDVECAGTLAIPPHTKPGPRKVLFEAKIVPGAAPNAAPDAKPSSRPTGIAAKGQASFSVVLPKAEVAAAEKPIEAWAGSWDLRRSSDGKSFRNWPPGSTPMTVRVVGDDLISVERPGKPITFKVRGNEAISRESGTLTLSADGKVLTWRDKSRTLENGKPLIVELTYVRVAGPTPSPTGKSPGSC